MYISMYMYGVWPPGNWKAEKLSLSLLALAPQLHVCTAPASNSSMASFPSSFVMAGRPRMLVPFATVHVW